MGRKFGRRIPKTWEHVEKYPFHKMEAKLRKLGTEFPEVVEKELELPKWAIAYYDQHPYNACVGYSLSMSQSIHNKKPYKALWLYWQSTLVDNDPETNPSSDSGAYIWAAMSILQKRGHRLENRLHPSKLEGIYSYYWGENVDDLRKAIGVNRTVILGINWYANFGSPELVGWEYWIGRGNLGMILGGHAVCCYGASDERQAFKFVNTWGTAYPPVWIDYDLTGMLLEQGGEAGIGLDVKSLKKR